MKLITDILATFPTSIITIERWSENINDIWEQTRDWSAIFSNIKSIFSLRSQRWAENEWWGKLNVDAKFTAKFDIWDIWEDIGNINTSDRAIIWWIIYKIEFIHYMAQDHVIIYLNEFD